MREIAHIAAVALREEVPNFFSELEDPNGPEDLPCLKVTENLVGAEINLYFAGEENDDEAAYQARKVTESLIDSIESGRAPIEVERTRSTYCDYTQAHKTITTVKYI